MQYKQNIDKTLERLTDLYNGKGKNKIFAKMIVPSKALEDYAKSYIEGEIPYPDLQKREQFWNTYLKEQTYIEDDSVPSAYMSEFDEGLYAGLLGAEIRFVDNPDWGWVSSMAVPFAQSVSELSNLSLNTENQWAKIFVDQLKFYAKKSKDKYGISHFILIDGLNLLLELRGGTNMFLDTADYPDKIQEFVKFGRKVNYYVQDTYFKEIGLYKGGTFSNMGQWIPGKIVSESLDPFHMTSMDYFEEWGRPNVNEVFSYYDGGCVHLHFEYCKNLIAPVSSINKLKMIAIIDEDFNTDKGYKNLEAFDKLRGDIPLCITIPFDVFTERLNAKALPGNIFYNVTQTPSAEIANDIMKKVVNYKIKINGTV